MRKALLPVFLPLLMAAALLGSCSARPDYYGSWEGDVLLVSVRYTLYADSFVQETYSFNDVLIQSQKGSLDAEDGRLVMKVTDIYQINPDTNTGRWVKTDDSIAMQYYVTGDRLELRPKGTGMTIALVRR
jgi:hypothetical protein